MAVIGTNAKYGGITTGRRFSALDISTGVAPQLKGQGAGADNLQNPGQRSQGAESVLSGFAPDIFDQ